MSTSSVNSNVGTLCIYLVEFKYIYIAVRVAVVLQRVPVSFQVTCMDDICIGKLRTLIKLVHIISLAS